MALSQAYLEWEKQTELRGIERGRIQGHREAIINLMRLRYGEIDAALQSIMPKLMALESAECTRLLLQLSKAELMQHCERLA
jgi:hypothetical protein